MLKKSQKSKKILVCLIFAFIISIVMIIGGIQSLNYREQNNGLTGNIIAVDNVAKFPCTVKFGEVTFEMTATTTLGDMIEQTGCTFVTDNDSAIKLNAGETKTISLQKGNTIFKVKVENPYNYATDITDSVIYGLTDCPFAKK